MYQAGNDYYEYKGWRIVWNQNWRGLLLEHVECDAGGNPEYGLLSSCPQCGSRISRDTWEHLRRAQKFLQVTE